MVIDQHLEIVLTNFNNSLSLDITNVASKTIQKFALNMNFAIYK